LSLIGASAGALTTALFHSEADFERSLSLAHQYVDDLNLVSNPSGLAGIWGGIIRNWLEELIPPISDSKQLHNVHIIVTPVTFPFQPKLLSNLQNKQELIDACMASAHLPFFMDGKFSTQFNGQSYIDGSIWSYFTDDIVLPPTTSNVYAVDFRRDSEFRNYCPAPGKLISKETALDMMNSGYKFMSKEHHSGRLTESLQE
jgi:predicted acylesterase/phospholipase RssA